MKTFFTIHAVAQKSDGQILLLQRTPNRHEHPNMWNFVTGYVAERESAEDAALRELREETNLTGEIIKSAQPYSEMEGDICWVVAPVFVKVTNEQEFLMDKKESQAFKWVNLNDELVQKTEWIKRTLKELGLMD